MRRTISNHRLTPVEQKVPEFLILTTGDRQTAPEQTKLYLAHFEPTTWFLSQFIPFQGTKARFIVQTEHATTPGFADPSPGHLKVWSRAARYTADEVDFHEYDGSPPEVVWLDPRTGQSQLLKWLVGSHGEMDFVLHALEPVCLFHVTDEAKTFEDIELVWCPQDIFFQSAQEHRPQAWRFFQSTL